MKKFYLELDYIDDKGNVLYKILKRCFWRDKVVASSLTKERASLIIKELTEMGINYNLRDDYLKM